MSNKHLKETSSERNSSFGSFNSLLKEVHYTLYRWNRTWAACHVNLKDVPQLMQFLWKYHNLSIDAGGIELDLRPLQGDLGQDPIFNILFRGYSKDFNVWGALRWIIDLYGSHVSVFQCLWTRNILIIFLKGNFGKQAVLQIQQCFRQFKFGFPACLVRVRNMVDRFRLEPVLFTCLPQLNHERFVLEMLTEILFIFWKQCWNMTDISLNLRLRSFVRTGVLHGVDRFCFGFKFASFVIHVDLSLSLNGWFITSGVVRFSMLRLGNIQ